MRKRKILWDSDVGVSATLRAKLNSIYYYPNRPMLTSADPDNPSNPSRAYIDRLEASGMYVAELKWNGDNTLIYTDNETWWNRTKAPLRYLAPPEVKEELRSIFPKGTIINVETVDRCTPTIKDKIVVHCLMAYNGELLHGKTWGEQRAILEGLNFSGSKHVILSQTWKRGFWDLFQYACEQDASIEGIILKNPAGRLVFSAKPIKDVSWMLKIRKPCNKYLC